jgi:hypothetical protein
VFLPQSVGPSFAPIQCDTEVTLCIFLWILYR